MKDVQIKLNVNIEIDGVKHQILIDDFQDPHNIAHSFVQQK